MNYKTMVVTPNIIEIILTTTEQNAIKDRLDFKKKNKNLTISCLYGNKSEKHRKDESKEMQKYAIRSLMERKLMQPHKWQGCVTKVTLKCSREEGPINAQFCAHWMCI